LYVFFKAVKPGIYGPNYEMPKANPLRNSSQFSGSSSIDVWIWPPSCLRVLHTSQF
jgi:hypothetical protein